MLVAALIDVFDAPFMQRAALELLLLAVPAGILGSWVVLHRLAFFTHAAGTAALPGLVVAGPWGIAPSLAALGAAGAFAGGVESLRRRARVGADAATGLLLTGSVALGVVLASDVYASGAGLDRLLFGSLLAVSAGDVILTALLAAVVLTGDAALRRAWLVRGFDPDSARALGHGRAAADRALLALVALAVVVALDAVGALLVSALFVIPAATVRLWARTLRALRIGSMLLAAAEGLVALALAHELNVGPGAALATLGGALFAVAALARRARG